MLVYPIILVDFIVPVIIKSRSQSSQEKTSKSWYIVVAFSSFIVIGSGPLNLLLPQNGHIKSLILV